MLQPDDAEEFGEMNPAVTVSVIRRLFPKLGICFTHPLRFFDEDHLGLSMEAFDSLFDFVKRFFDME